MQPQRLNPLVWPVLAVSGVIAITLAREPLEFGTTAASFLLLSVIFGLQLKPVMASLSLVLPASLILFTIHMAFVILTQPETALLTAVAGQSITLLRYLGLTIVMGAVVSRMEAQALVDSVKTLMDRLGVRSRLSEDLLQTLRLILVFIPQVRRDFERLQHYNRALGLSPRKSLLGRLSFFGEAFLPLLSRSLTRARQLGTIMDLRGYGIAVPRGQLRPLPLRWQDGVAMLSIIALFGSVQWVL